MTITVRELVSIPHLQTHVLAGATGLEREITWAHACELSNPTPWLTGGELIMTTGLAIPEIAQEQEAYLLRLIQAHVSGLAIAEEMHAPKLTDSLQAVANRYAFPILLTAYEVPWIALTRAVADATMHEGHARVVQTLRVYETARLAIQHTSPLAVVGKLGEILDCTLHVVDPSSRRSLFHGMELPRSIADAIEYTLASSASRSPAVRRLELSDVTAWLLSVPASRPALLLAVPSPAVTPDALVLRHVATIVGLAIERDTAAYERQRRQGAEILAGLIDRRLTADAAHLLLAEHELGEEPRCLIACSTGTQTCEYTWLHLQLHARRIPHLLLHRGDVLLALLPATADALVGLQAELPTSARLGVSEVLGYPTRAVEAYREALWALGVAEAHGKSIACYSEEISVSPFLPRSRSETQELVEQVLGDLLAYDARNSSQLVLTLYVYLQENRSWQRASQALHIHKQTLVYRINRIEQMTRRHLDKTNDVAELWFALQAATMLSVVSIPL